MLKDFFYFPRSERRGIVVLVAVLMIVLLLVLLKGKRETTDGKVATEAAVADSLAPAPTGMPAELFSFNPNKADSATLRALGLTERVASNIVKYRRAGGSFRKADDLARIYGMDSATFQRLRPYILIPHEPSERTAGRQRNDYQSRRDSLTPAPPREESPYKAYMENKLPEGSVVDVNTADTALLMRIPGIGPYFAQRIVGYRNRLGGFHSVEQIYEIENLPENLGVWLCVGDEPCRKIHVNRASLKELRDHPYIGYYRARAIVDLRKSDGRVRNLRQLSFLDVFSEEDVKRLEPYLDFD